MTGTAVDPLLTAALACVDAFYARVFRDWPDAVTRTRGDCTLSFSGDTRLTGANHVWPNSASALTDDVLDEAQRFFAPFQAAWSVICTEPYMPLAVGWLERRGYAARWSSPLMVLEGVPIPLPVRPHAEVIRANSPDHLDAIALVMSEAFATGSSVNRRVARPAHLADPAMLHYLVYSGDEPAGCATVALHNGMAGIWNVGTRYPFRRQGYATTIMRALLDDLRARGVTVSMLMASPAGQRLYETLGYRHVGLTTYMGPPYFSSRYDA